MKILAKHVALPNGYQRDGRTANLSLYLNIELLPTTSSENGTMVLIGSTILSSWNFIINHAHFSLDIDGAPVSDLTKVSQNVGFNPWVGLIVPLYALLSSPANREANMFGDSPVLSYPADEIFKQLKELYANAFNSISGSTADSSNSINDNLRSRQVYTRYPAANLLNNAESFGQLARPGVLDDSINDSIKKTRTKTGSIFDMALEFHSRSEEQQQEMISAISAINMKLGTSSNGEYLLEFHRRVAMLSNYPALMRALGLVLDFSFDASSIGTRTGRLRLSVEFETPEIFPVATPILYESNPEIYRFAIQDASTSQDFQAGLLKLDDDQQFSVRQIDIAGSAMKAVAFADDLARLKASNADDKPESLAPPSIQTNGISLFRKNHRNKLLKSHAEQIALRKLATTKDVGDITSAQVIKGFRIDVLAKGSRLSKWFNLHNRIVKLRVITVREDIVLDLPPDSTEGWTGFSMSAEGAGTTRRAYVPEDIFTWKGWSPIVDRPATAMPRDNTLPHSTHVTQLPRLLEEIEVPNNSSPPLRFGYVYQFRARTVDLAGNDMAGFIIDPSLHLTPPLIYKRFEPIEPPTLVLRNSLQNSFGESLDHLVIRGRHDSSTNQTSERHVVPPKSSLEMITMHGMFDDMNIDVSYQLAYDKADGFLPDTAEASEIKLPYLPDPLCKGAVVEGLPKGPGLSPRPDFLSIAFDGKWPDLGTFRIILKEGTKPAEWSSNFNELTVFSPKASITCLKLSSQILEQDLRILGMADWIGNLDGRLVTEGKMWMFTPWRTVVLINAVKKPLAPPKFLTVSPNRALRVARQFDSTSAQLLGELGFEPRSTGKFDIHAEWTDTIDDAAECKPKSVDQRSTVYQYNAEYPQSPDFSEPPVLQTFPMGSDQNKVEHTIGDTHHHKIRYSAAATSRYLEYFLPKDAIHPESADFISGFTQTTPVDQQPVINVPSTARPAACAIKYAIPLFGWTNPEKNESAGKESISRTRNGGAFRVFIERPWFSSGNEEQLGIVYWPGVSCNGSSSTWDPPKELKGLVSGWGNDSIWVSGNIAERLQPRHFLNRISIPDEEVTYTLDELSPSSNSWGPSTNYPECHRVSVVRYQPIFDETRGVWYCDIQMDYGSSYKPFVSLALARFQPNSLSERVGSSIRDCHLSRVTLSDFVQLSPTRSVTLTYSSHHTTEVIVTVTGISFSRSFHSAGTSVIEVTLERRDKKDKLGWVSVPPAVTLQPVPSHENENFYTWSGPVPLPEKKKSGRFRLVIREFEPFGSSAADRRLVYADALVLE